VIFNAKQSFEKFLHMVEYSLLEILEGSIQIISKLIKEIAEYFKSL